MYNDSKNAVINEYYQQYYTTSKYQAISRSVSSSVGFFEIMLFLRSIVKRVAANDNKMTINHALTLPADISSKEVVSVPDIIPLSPPKRTIPRTVQRSKRCTGGMALHGEEVNPLGGWHSVNRT